GRPGQALGMARFTFWSSNRHKAWSTLRAERPPARKFALRSCRLRPSTAPAPGKREVIDQRSLAKIARCKKRPGNRMAKQAILENCVTGIWRRSNLQNSFEAGQVARAVLRHEGHVLQTHAADF